MTHRGWREVDWDPETLALRRLSKSALDILNSRSSPFEEPRWVEDFERNRRRLELSGREGAETLDVWRAQTEDRIAAQLDRRPRGLLHLLGLLRRLPSDVVFLGEREEEGSLRRFDAYQADVTERAVLKYARWDASGVKLDVWEPGMSGFAQDIPTVDAERLAEILSLIEVGAVRLAHLEKLRRSIVRGQTVVVRPDGVSDSRPAPELQKRINLYDERTYRFSFLGETAGTFDPSRGDNTEELGQREPSPACP